QLQLRVNSKEATCTTKQLTILLEMDSSGECYPVDSLFCTTEYKWDTTGNLGAYSSLVEAMKDPKFELFYVRCVDPGEECE
ncbi:hypothetical protein PENTCL1PPCAC_20900, partial [Pristionchus entomophagus]